MQTSYLCKSVTPASIPFPDIDLFFPGEEEDKVLDDRGFSSDIDPSNFRLNLPDSSSSIGEPSKHLHL